MNIDRLLILTSVTCLAVGALIFILGMMGVFEMKDLIERSKRHQEELRQRGKHYAKRRPDDRQRFRQMLRIASIEAWDRGRGAL